MRQIFAEAEHHDVDRILLNAHNLAPRNLGDRSAEGPFWVRDFGFELGMHITPSGDLPVPGLGNVCADQVVALRATEDELFQGLESACQAAIRKAERSGLTFTEATGDPIKAYYDLATVSAQRTGEVLLPISYYQTIWDRLRSDQRFVFFVRNEERLAAALYLVIDKGAASFLAGVSHHEFLTLRVNDYMHWQALRWAKAARPALLSFGARVSRIARCLACLSGVAVQREVRRAIVHDNSGKLLSQSRTLRRGCCPRRHRRLRNAP